MIKQFIRSIGWAGWIYYALLAWGFAGSLLSGGNIHHTNIIFVLPLLVTSPIGLFFCVYGFFNPRALRFVTWMTTRTQNTGLASIMLINGAVVNGVILAYVVWELLHRL